MIGVALALIVAAVVMLFIVPAVGIGVGVVGLLLVVAYLAGLGRRPKEDRV